MSETPLMREIQVALAGAGARIFRNQVGVFELKDGRWIRAGLCPGSSDLIGIMPDGRFLSVEVKVPDGPKPTEQQLKWLLMVKDMKGVAFRARSVEEALELFRNSLG